MSKVISWKNVFNSQLKHYQSESVVRQKAQKCGYSYYIWKGRVYETISGEDSGCSVEDIL